MVGVGLALAASIGWGLSDFVAGVKARQLSVLTVLVCSQAIGLAAVLPVVVVGGGGPPPAGAVLTAALAGGLEVAGFACLYRALAIGEMTVVGPVAALTGVVPLACGLAGGEQPSMLQVLGIAVAVAGAAAAALGETPRADERRVAAAALAAAAAVCFGGFFTALGDAGEQAPLWATLVCRGCTVAGLAGVLAVRRASVAGARPHLAGLSAVGLLDVGANALYAVAVTSALVSVVGVLGSIYPVFTALAAVVVLHERLSGVQSAGVLACLGGVGMLSAGA
jgi:drug/metabolite transporter (DMT)-like permease